MAQVQARLSERNSERLSRERDDARACAHRMLVANDVLQRGLRQTEVDTHDAIKYLQCEIDRRDAQVKSMRAQLATADESEAASRRQIEELFARQLAELSARLANRQMQVAQLKREFQSVDEYQERREKIDESLDMLRESIRQREQQHRDALSGMEQKFLEERMKIQAEAMVQLGQFRLVATGNAPPSYLIKRVSK